jgi:MarR family 2-MHQ and catechol resistance regulon transcriptional repressor
VGTRYEGTAEEVRALDAYIALMRAAETTTARIHRHLAEVELTVGQFGALEALFHLGAMRQNELARKVLRSAGNMTLVLDNLERRGLVRRERETGDRRCTTVHLTAQGRRLVQRVFPRHAATVVAELRALGAAEQVELARLCRRLAGAE